MIRKQKGLNNHPYLLYSTMLHRPLHLVLLVGAAFGSPPQRSSRICRPPPPRPNSSQPVCLVVGDSVSIGMTNGVAIGMAGTCAVVHAPFSGDGGACDTNYGLQCADLWLGSALDGSPAPKYAAITFNFGEPSPTSGHKANFAITREAPRVGRG